jgi:hypothetical protein
MHDGVPFLFQHRVTDQRAIICLHPKAGSTNLKFLFRFAGKSTPAEMTLKQILEESPHSRPTSRVGDIKEAFMNAKVPRIMIVRNPYIRLLSGFLDTIEQRQELSYGPPTYKSGESFEVFVEKLAQQQWNPDAIDFNNHFKLQSKNCLMNDGMSYDYYLPLEEMDFWYEPLVNAMQLNNFTQLADWAKTTTAYHGNPKQPCFYTSFNRTCNQMLQGGYFSDLVDFFFPKRFAADGTTILPDDDEEKVWLERTFSKAKIIDIFGERRQRRGLRGLQGEEEGEGENSLEEGDGGDSATDGDDSQGGEGREGKGGALKKRGKMRKEAKGRPAGGAAGEAGEAKKQRSQQRQGGAGKLRKKKAAGKGKTDDAQGRRNLLFRELVSMFSPSSSSSSPATSSSSSSPSHSSEGSPEHAADSAPSEVLRVEDVKNPYLSTFHTHVYQQAKTVVTAYTVRGNSTYHTTGSLQKVAKYFDHTSVIEKTTKWILPDLKEFKYPIWYRNMTAKDYLTALFIDMPQKAFTQFQLEA